MSPFTLATFRSIAFSFGCGIFAVVVAFGRIPGAQDAPPIILFAFMGGALIGWSTTVKWFFREVPARPGRAFEVIPHRDSTSNE